jgi:hypothetical protein
MGEPDDLLKKLSCLASQPAEGGLEGFENGVKPIDAVNW